MKDIELLFIPEFSPEDKALITKAYAEAFTAHKDMVRFTGEPYFTHVFETARKLTLLRMDARTIAAGLLHDTIEDGRISEERIQKEFGEEVLFLVKGVTKLGKLEYHGLKRHAESLRKLFIATAQDVRVLIIRLADRLHNIETLHGHSSEEKRKRIALETLEIFAPVANRLGMGQLKGELEDGAFPYAYPEEHKKVEDLLKQRAHVNQKYLEKVRRSLARIVADAHISILQMDYRIKHKWSLYQKLLKNKMNIEEVHDVVALRIIVKNIEDCYRVLGIVHMQWKPLPGRIKDYIAIPKPNGYRSIHTTIFTGDGGIAEIQIRTQEMHEEAEYGIASHFMYKEKTGALKKKPNWIKDLLDWQKHVSESGEFLKSLKTDFFKNRVFAFTPDGDVIDLPEESTVIDFAYAIHSDIGNHMWGAKINGKMATLESKLSRGDIVEILTRKDARPYQKWLSIAKTAQARKRINHALNPKKG